MATFPLTELQQYIGIGSKKLAIRSSGRSLYSESNIMTESCFLNLLRIEGKRTERSSNPFMLMILDVETLLQKANRQRSLRTLVAALHASIRETDTLGWYEEERKLGILFSEIGPDSANSDVIIRRNTMALQRTLPLSYFESLALTFQVFGEGGEIEGTAGSNALTVSDRLSVEEQTAVAAFV